MAKWWNGVAVVVLCLAAVSGARAQFGPQASGLPPLSEPIPFGPSGPACAAPAAPPAAPACESPTPPLPGDTTNAFDQELPHARGPTGWYAGAGALALQRARHGPTTVAVVDPFGFDNDFGPPAPANAPVVQTLGDVHPGFAAGVMATVGYHGEDCALELSGFYVPQNEAAAEYANEGRIDSFFFNGPPGFLDQWTQADRIRTTLRTALGNAELNTLWWSNNYYENFQLIAGVRYLDIQERLQISTTEDEALTGEVPEPAGAATYTVKSRDRILAGQLGLAFNSCICPWLSVGASAKAAVGANSIDVDVLLQRGDGLVGFAGHRNGTIVSQIYDAGLFLDWHFWDGVHLRTGYTALWVVHVPEAMNQLDFNLAHTLGRDTNDGNIFFHGPQAELELCF